jgi:hypothetical protein
MEDTALNRVIMCLVTALFLAVAGTASAQSTTAADSTDAVEEVSSPPPAKPASSGSKIYWGGALGFSFWGDYSRIAIEPLVGYKLTPKLSLGAKLRYEYINDRRSGSDYSSHNYGASIFSRYRIVLPLYVHAEFAYMSYDYSLGREEVPFLLLGGGYSQPMGKNAWAFVEILFDVIQDENSPYKDWEPFISIGVSVGF